MIRLTRTIVLVGLMGAGKTSVGRRVADMLSVGFHDSDDAVVEAAGMSIPEIFSKFGEADFRRGERDVIQRLIGGPPCILATGGGAFMNDETRAVIKETALSVWLKVDLPVLWARVADKPGRPLLDTEDPYGTLRDLLAERAPVYAEADVTLPCGKRDSLDTVAKALVRAVVEYGRAQPDRAALAKDGQDNG